MNDQEPRIIELDPEGAPRLTAFILLACGLLGVGFLLVNVVFTGDDQYYIESEWDEGTEPVNQRFDIIPNLVRGRHVGADSEEDEEAEVPVRRTAPKRTTTGPTSPFAPRATTPGSPGLSAGSGPGVTSGSGSGITTGGTTGTPAK